MHNRIDYSAMVGVKMGKLFAVSIAGKIKNKMHLNCICACGNWKVVNYYNFVRGGSLSCGCSKTLKKVSYDYKHPLYKIWIAMRARCNNPNDSYYYNYGERGVRVCAEWDREGGFQLFYNWCMANGWRRGLFVDKDIKGNGLLYSPDTCSIVTRKMNNQARKCVKINLDKAKEIRASALPASELCLKYGISRMTVWDIRSGRTWKEAKVIGINDFKK